MKCLMCGSEMNLIREIFEKNKSKGRIFECPKCGRTRAENALDQIKL